MKRINRQRLRVKAQLKKYRDELDRTFGTLKSSNRRRGQLKDKVTFPLYDKAGPCTVCGHRENSTYHIERRSDNSDYWRYGARKKNWWFAKKKHDEPPSSAMERVCGNCQHVWLEAVPGTRSSIPTQKEPENVD